MLTSRSFKVLTGNRLALKLSNLYNENSLRFGSQIISDKLYFALLLLPGTFVCSSMLYRCYELGFDFTKISSIIDLLIGTFQMMLVFAFLAAQKDVLIRTIDQLQQMISGSK